jgi:hypothetical protein
MASRDNRPWDEFLGERTDTGALGPGAASVHSDNRDRHDGRTHDIPRHKTLLKKPDGGAICATVARLDGVSECALSPVARLDARVRYSSSVTREHSPVVRHELVEYPIPGARGGERLTAVGERTSERWVGCKPANS